MSQSELNQTARANLAELAVRNKISQNLTWEQIAEGSGLSVVFVTAAILGQQTLPAAVAELVAKRLNLGADAASLLQSIPQRGSLKDAVPTDPTIYRLYEIVQVYGTTLKTLLHEQFGDGIMSAINFKMSIEKIEDPEGGHRAVIKLDGKFLPYKPF